MFRRGIASQEAIIFRGEMFPLVARRRHDFVKLILSSVCCNKVLTLWDLAGSVFEVSFWGEALERCTIDIVMGTVYI